MRSPVVERIGPYALAGCVRSDEWSRDYRASRGGRTVRLTVASPAVVEVAELRGYVHRCRWLPVLPVLDAGVAGGRVWVASEEPGQVWVPHEMDWSEVVAVVVAVGEVLRACHATGVVHYGLTPDDITIADGRVLVDVVRARVDWTVGRNDMDSFSLVGDPRGTAWYEAPELWAGWRRGEQSDLYSLCAVAWRALAGAPAFAGEMSFERVERVLAGPPAAPVGGEVPAWVWSALARGLSPRTGDRWSTLAGLLAALTG